MVCVCVVCWRCRFHLGRGDWVVFFLLLTSSRGATDQQCWGVAFGHSCHGLCALLQATALPLRSLSDRIRLSWQNAGASEEAVLTKSRGCYGSKAGLVVHVFGVREKTDRRIQFVTGRQWGLCVGAGLRWAQSHQLALRESSGLGRRDSVALAADLS